MLTALFALPLVVQAPLGRPAQNVVPEVRPLPVEAVQTIELAPLNIGEIEKEDFGRLEEGLPPRYAVPLPVNYSPSNSGTWEELGNGELLWRLRFTTEGAAHLNFGFDEYRMTPGGQLRIYSPDPDHGIRPFTAADNDDHGQLWTPVVLSRQAVLELRIPADELDDLRLNLAQVSHGYRGFGRVHTYTYDSLRGSGSCNVDVVCSQGDDWRLDIASVAVISTGGSTFCSGFMVNNTSNDLTPYFMTADHCGIGVGNAPSLVTFWNYENSTCRPIGASGGNGDGLLTQFNSGAVHLADRSASDFTLVLLDDDPDPAWDVAFAGWDATGTNATAAIAIHHPDGDEKRISFEDQPTTTTTYLQTGIPGDGTHERVEDWDLGTTEPGSSGSPLWNQDHRVIGQLHGGFASCTSQTADWYGKFSVSWNAGGSSTTQLVDHLDAAGTGLLTTDTISLNTLCSDQGTVDILANTVGCNGSADVQVIDCGLNLDDLVAETINITINSTTDSAGESITLTEISPASGRFQGTVNFSDSTSIGAVLVTEGDTVNASYTDADDGMGGFNVLNFDMATVDCTGPAISNVQITAVTATTATISYDTDEPAGGSLAIGTTCGAADVAPADSGQTMTKTFEVAGLFPSTDYRVEITATDEAGNATVDDNGGVCYAFSTPVVAESYTEEFSGDFDLVGTSTLFQVREPNPLYPDPQDPYTTCTTSISRLPVAPFVGNTLSMTDDDSELVTLTGGKTVELFGVSYSSVYVGSNGYLTFTGPDTDYNETLAEHYQEPRVSVTYDDFNPSAGGTVKWRQLGDRLVVTWINVPEFSTSNQNTFQVEMFFERGAIRISHMNMASSDSIIGLSAGNGIPSDYVPDNLSNRQDCLGDIRVNAGRHQ